MGTVTAAILALAGIFGAVLSRVLSDELKAWNPWIVERLIRFAEQKLPHEFRARLSEEWRSHIAEIPGDLGKVLTAYGFIRAAGKIRGGAVTVPNARVLALIAIAALLPLMLTAAVALESVRKHQAGLQSFRSMRRMDARRRNVSALRLRFSQSLTSRRHRLSQAMVRSTTQRRGSTTNPLA